jgi:hypothetical protein
LRIKRVTSVTRNPKVVLAVLLIVATYIIA